MTFSTRRARKCMPSAAISAHPSLHPREITSKIGRGWRTAGLEEEARSHLSPLARALLRDLKQWERTKPPFFDSTFHASRRSHSIRRAERHMYLIYLSFLRNITPTPRINLEGPSNCYRNKRVICCQKCTLLLPHEVEKPHHWIAWVLERLIFLRFVPKEQLYAK